MQSKYGKDGLVTVSVAVFDPEVDGEPTSEESQKKILGFLEQMKATFPNYLLDEPVALWQEKFNISGPPCVYVFDRAGKMVKLGAAESEEVDKVVQEFLKK